jgi:acetyl-CoA carboxylase carboxyltransferase component
MYRMNRHRSSIPTVAALLGACAAGAPAIQRGTVPQRPDTFVSLSDVDPSI